MPSRERTSETSDPKARSHDSPRARPRDSRRTALPPAQPPTLQSSAYIFIAQTLFTKSHTVTYRLPAHPRPTLERLGDWFRSLDALYRTHLRGVSVKIDDGWMSSSEWANMAWELWKVADSMPTSTPNTEQKPFQLLDLPPEIWSDIAKRIVDNLDIVTWNDIILKRSPAAPAVAQTCQALRTEVLPYYYKNKIYIRMTSADTERGLTKVGDWFARVAEDHLKYVGGVVVRDVTRVERNPPLGRLHERDSHVWNERIEKLWSSSIGFELVLWREVEGEDRIYDVQFW